MTNLFMLALGLGLVLAYLSYLPLASAARMSSSAAAVAHQRRALLASGLIGAAGALAVGTLVLLAR